MRRLFIGLAILLGIAAATAQQTAPETEYGNNTLAPIDTLSLPIMTYESVTDSLFQNFVPQDTVMSFSPLPIVVFMPSVFTQYQMPDTASLWTPDYSGESSFRWLEDAKSSSDRFQAMKHTLQINNPQIVRYNLATLPEAPKKYIVEVNPQDHTINISEMPAMPAEALNMETTKVEKKHWLKTFNASLQFSQAYVSPNWYQGGTNNLNAILNLYYNVKLNPAYHPNLLFENTFQYKLGINSAPDDTIRSYNVSEDIFQVNTVFGVKAFKKWYYSFTGQFKTQLVNSYKSNTNTLRSALMSPAELNLGLGMTFNTANAKKTFTFDASISPLSYNMMICTKPNDQIPHGQYGIAEDRTTVSKMGSSAECKMMCKITRNITLNSRLFGFTDYSRAYADWENTFVFEINKYLTTQLFVHLRYDTDTPPIIDNPDWHKLQVKEILSLGFAYKFSTI